MTRKQYRPWSPDTVYLLPPSTRDWLPKDHLAHFILDVVAELDLSDIESVLQSRDPRGVVPYPPQMMVALLLYGYARGVYSSRRIARATYEDIAMRFIAGEHHPHFTTIASFRQEHLDALAKLFVQALQMCSAAGLVKLGHVSLDGTKIQANASKHSAMSYERMQAEEKRLKEEVETLLSRARTKDAEEDEQLGADQDELDIPEELARREARLEAIRAARAALEEEAARARAAELRALAESNERRAAEDEDTAQATAAATRAVKQRKQADELDPPAAGPDDEPPSGAGTGPTLPTHSPDHDASGTPSPKAQRNFTDPESRIMKKGSDFLQGYNAQAAVDAESHVIVAQALSNQAPDAEYLPAVVQGIEDNLGRLPEKVSADAGYWSEENATWCEERGVDAYIATRRERHNGQGPTLTPAQATAPAEAGPSTSSTPAPESASPEGLPASAGTTSRSAREKMREKLSSPAGREVYRLRKCTPEPVFGNIKEARGFRRFLLRGLQKVRQEWALMCTVHNLLKLHGARMAAT